jgi:predicted GIY-YIG superfamily endonuclease
VIANKPAAESVKWFPFYSEEWRLWVLNPNHLPTVSKALAFSGVYAWFDDNDECLYVGESKYVQKRLKAHFKLTATGRRRFRWRGRDVSDPLMWVVPIDNISERLECEERAILVPTPPVQHRLGGFVAS